MATPDQIQPTGNLATGISLANLFLGKTTSTSGTTQTSSEQVSSDKANAYIQNILSGVNGLSAVTQGQKTAGLYNSSTNQLLTNDLLARTAAQTAALSATKTTNTSGTVQKVAPQISSTSALGGLALLQLLPQDIKNQIKETDLYKGIFGNPAAKAKQVTDATGNIVNTNTINGSDAATGVGTGATTDSALETTSGVAGAADSGLEMTNAIDVASSLADTTDVASTGIDLVGDSTAAAEAGALDAAGTAVDGVAPGIGTLLKVGVQAAPEIASSINDTFNGLADIFGW